MAQATAALKEVPGSPAKWPMGDLGRVREIGMIDYLMEMWREHGDVFHMNLGPNKFYFAAHPDDLRKALLNNDKKWIRGKGYERLKTAIGERLLTSDGEVWHKRRKLMQPAFTPNAVAQYSRTINRTVAEISARWERLAEKGDPVYIDDEMKRLAMAVIGHIMMNLNLEDEAMRAAADFARVLDFASKPIGMPLFIPTPENQQYKRAYKDLRAFMEELIRNREGSGKEHDDMLNTLIHLKNDEGEGLTMDAIVDELLTLFFAGHETTALALAWSWYVLEKNPEVEDKLYDEVTPVIGDGHAPTLDELHRMPYTLQFFEEVMRLYPPIHIFSRDTVEDVELSGCHVPAGSAVIISPYVTHRHTDFWEDPEEIRPERFEPERVKERHRYAYLPFSQGGHICIGNNLALLEGHIALAMLARKFYLRLVPDFEVKMFPYSTLRFEHGLKMTIHKR
ncbi:MAG: cytochrome P450 [Anaerolineae bacterium]